MKYALIFVSLISLISCNKTEGEGGFATIKGLVTTYNLNGAGELIETYPAADEDVFIIYGTEDNVYNDKIATSFDGTFSFSYLNPGTYTLYVYSKCDSCPDGNNAIKKQVIISEKKEVVDAGEIIRYD